MFQKARDHSLQTGSCCSGTHARGQFFDIAQSWARAFVPPPRLSFPLTNLLRQQVRASCSSRTKSGNSDRPSTCFHLATLSEMDPGRAHQDGHPESVGMVPLEPRAVHLHGLLCPRSIQYHPLWPRDRNQETTSGLVGPQKTDRGIDIGWTSG